MSLIGVFSTGDVIENRYHLDFLVHEGRWGDIYRATDRLNDRPVALRFFPIADDGPADFERFTSHARELDGMSAPGLMTPIDHGMAREIPYLIFRWAKGQSLNAHLDEFGALDLSQSLILVEQLLRALRSAHRADLAHGLIRPTKIFLHNFDGNNPLIKLADFHIWRFYEWSSGKEAFDEQNLSRRILRYTGPELISDHRVSPATDLFSLGLVTLETLLGEPLLNENDRIALIGRQVSDEVYNLPADFDAGPELREFLSQLLEKPLARRLSNAGAALDLFHDRQDAFDAPSVRRQTAPGQDQKQAEEELFGKDPDQVRALSDGERLDGTIDDSLFDDQAEFGDFHDDDKPISASDEEESPPRPTRSRNPSTSPGATSVPPDQGDEDDDDFDPSIADSIPSASHRDRILTKRETESSAAASSPLYDEEEDEQSFAIVLSVAVVGMAILGAAIYFLIFAGTTGPATEETPAVEAATEADEAPPTYIIEIHTDPPAQRVLVAGTTEGMSPLQVEVTDDDFPLEIRARQTADNIKEKTLEAPQDVVHFSFD